MINNKHSLFQPQNRRGLSSVVGALFFTVLMIAGFSVLSLALDAQTDIVTTQRIVSDTEIKKQQEQFGVLASTDTNDVLTLSINNKGQNPVEISSIWIINKTLSEQPATRYAINYDDAFVTSGFTTDIVSAQTLQMVPDTYDIKVVSSLGTIKQVEFSNGGGGSSVLRAEMITDPPDVIIGQNVTIAMIVTNTGTDDTITNVQPGPLSLSATGSGSFTASSPSTPSSANLNPGASVMFTWDYQVTGDSGDELTFSSFATGDGVGNSNTVTDISILREPTDGGSGSGGEGIIIHDELFAKPNLSVVMAAPFGATGGISANKGLWGVNVANPTDKVMKVNKVVLSFFHTDSNGGDDMVKRNCAVENISPWGVSGAGDWKCVIDNQLRWKNNANPIEIPPKSVYSFLVKVETGGLDGNSSEDLESLPVQVTVLTNFGQFGKAGYDASMNQAADSVANIFLGNGGTDTSNSNINSTRTGIMSDSNATFDIWLADFNGDDGTIKANTDLIINVPKNWIVQGTPNGYGDWDVVVNIFPDTSSQIVGTLLSDITNGGKRITFTAKAPSVSEAKLYVFHSLANGLTADSFTVSPLSEIVVQVCTSTGCPT